MSHKNNWKITSQVSEVVDLLRTIDMVTVRKRHRLMIRAYGVTRPISFHKFSYDDDWQATSTESVYLTNSLTQVQLVTGWIDIFIRIIHKRKSHLKLLGLTCGNVALWYTWTLPWWNSSHYWNVPHSGLNWDFGVWRTVKSGWDSSG